MGIKIKKGFTLIETIVVVGVIGLTLPVIFAIFFVLLQQQTKIYRLNAVKKEGDYVITLLQSTIKNNAVSILSSTSPIPPTTNLQCNDDSTSYGSNSNLYFLDKNGLWFGYELNNSSLASVSSNLATVNLTSAKTQINNFSISCSRTFKFSQPSISLSFDIEYCVDVACSQTRPEETASLHYQTKVKLRNY
jgi:prepilin-type N-terminal cleavage/methylation domain-containing protein